jgi:hypothetical protein
MKPLAPGSRVQRELHEPVLVYEFDGPAAFARMVEWLLWGSFGTTYSTDLFLWSRVVVIRRGVHDGGTQALWLRCHSSRLAACDAGRGVGSPAGTT